MFPFYIRKSRVEKLPVDDETYSAISSDWAYDHAALKTAHGISTFGSTLVDDALSLSAEQVDALFEAASRL